MQSVHRLLSGWLFFNIASLIFFSSVTFRKCKSCFTLSDQHLTRFTDANLLVNVSYCHAKNPNKKICNIVFMIVIDKRNITVEILRQNHLRVYWNCIQIKIRVDDTELFLSWEENIQGISTPCPAKWVIHHTLFVHRL